MTVPLDESIPKYLWLKNTILDAARREEWPEGHRLPSEFEFAEEFAVSRTTVRQALNELENEGLVSRQRGRGTFYSPGRGAIVERHQLIGITTSLTGYIYTSIVRGAEEALSERGYHSLVGTRLLSEDMRRNIESDSISWRMDGLLFEPNARVSSVYSQEVIENVKSLGIPYVMINWTSDDPLIPWIAPDDVAAGELIGKYLIDRGHKRVSFVGIEGHQPTMDRLRGFSNLLESSGMELPRENCVLVKDRDIDQRQFQYYQVIRHLLETVRPLPTAMFCFSDQTAAEAYHAIKDTGLTIPEDISVISYDDSELGRALSPRLTTMVHPKEELGRWAARMLVDMIEHPDHNFPLQVKMQSHIAERDSVRSI